MSITRKFKEELREIKDNIISLVPSKWAPRSDPPVRRSPSGDPLSDLRLDVNRMFEHFFEDLAGGFPSTHLGEGLLDTAWPRLDVTERKKEIRVEVELPGIDRDEIQVSIHERVLEIRGQKQVDNEHEEDGQFTRECYRGTFHRAIVLPAPVDGDRATARLKRGVLDIRLPKITEPTPSSRRIDVR